MYVYMISNGKKGHIKIGKAANVETRLMELQVGNPVELFIVAKIPAKSHAHALDMEAYFHRVFRKHRIRGEWFDRRIFKRMAAICGHSLKTEYVTNVADDENNNHWASI